MGALEGVQLPLVGEQGQQHAVRAAGEHLAADQAGFGQGGGAVGVSDPGHAVGELVEGDRGRELVLHPVQDHIELHRADRGHDRRLVATPVGDQHLDHAFLVELGDALAELLGPADVLGPCHREVLGGEGGQRGELGLPAGEEGVADPQRARVDQADHIAGVRGVDHGALGAEDGVRVLGCERAAAGGPGDVHAALEDAGADSDEGDPVAMGRVHVRLDLEHQAGELLADLAAAALGQLAGPGSRSEVDHGVQQELHTYVGQRGAEEDRADPAGLEGILVVAGAGREHQLQLLQRGRPGFALLLGGLLGGELLLEGGVRAGRHLGVAQHLLGVPRFDQAAQVARAAHRPDDRDGGDPEVRLDVLEQGERVLAAPVPLVDEGDHGDTAMAADREQLAGLLLQALGRVDQHDRAVDGGQHPVGVLGEVGVAGGVDQVHHVAAIAELQRGRGHRDTALAFQFHPVAGHAASVTLGVHRTGGSDRPRVQRQRLGERGLARVRMADHSEGPSTAGLTKDLRDGDRLYGAHVFPRVRIGSRPGDASPYLVSRGSGPQAQEAIIGVGRRGPEIPVLRGRG